MLIPPGLVLTVFVLKGKIVCLMFGVIFSIITWYTVEYIKRILKKYSQIILHTQFKNVIVG